MALVCVQGFSGQSSKFFFCLEKKNRVDRWISALKDENGIIHADVDGISLVLSSFYSSLFSSEVTILWLNPFC